MVEFKLIYKSQRDKTEPGPGLGQVKDSSAVFYMKVFRQFLVLIWKMETGKNFI